MPRAATERTITVDATSIAEQIETAIADELDDVSQIISGTPGVDLRPTFEAYLTHLAELHESYFEQQKSPGGASWTPLAPATVKRKGHAIILVDTGDLAASLSSRSHENNIAEVIQEGKNKGVSFGTMDAKSIFHQDSRPHVGITDRSADQLAEAIADRVVDALIK